MRTRSRVAVTMLVAMVPLLVSSPAQARRSWAYGAVKTVVAARVLPDVTVSTFHPTRPLDHGTLAMLVWGAVPSSIGVVTIPTDSDPATIAELDAAYVAALGLSDLAAQAHDGLVAAGYTPRDDAGTEIVARLLGLRFNLPVPDDRLERADTEPATRADAAYTTAVVLRGVDIPWARAAVAKIAALPATTGERHAVIDRAVHLIGMPYVWGGTWDAATGGPAGSQAHGGFDCSGLVWRTFVYDPAALPRTAARIGGRTTYQMAGSTPARKRLRRSLVRPGDILLFAPTGRKALPSQVGHSGIAIGNGLMIHSSSQGVALTVWDTGWHRTSFAWGKSVLPR